MRKGECEPVELRQLKYFKALAETGSVSRASVALSVAQPAVSRQIRLLEEQLGIRLFHRTGRGMELTEAGHVFAERSSMILGELQQLEHDIREMRGVTDGQVVLGVPPTESAFLVTPLIRRLRERHPGISLRVVEAFSGHVNEWLMSGRVDVALFYKVPRTQHMVADELLTEGLFLIGTEAAAAKDAPPLQLTELKNEKLILPSRSHGLRIVVDQAAHLTGIALNVHLEIDALPTIKSLVEAGIGSTILPYPSIQRDVEEGRLNARPIDKKQLSRTLLIATSTQHPLTKSSRVVVRQTRDLVRELVESGAWIGAV